MVKALRLMGVVFGAYIAVTGTWMASSGKTPALLVGLGIMLFGAFVMAEFLDGPPEA